MGENIIIICTVVFAIGIFLFFLIIMISQLARRPKYESAENEPESAAEIFKKDMELAKNEVRFVCGDFSKKFFDFPGIKESLVDAIDRGVDFSAIIGSDFDREAKEFLKENGVELYEKKHKINELFRVIDDDRFYIQKPRKSKKEGQRRVFLRGENSPFEAKFLLDKFYLLKK